MADPEVVKSALQMLAESEGREWNPAPEPEKPQTPQLQPLDQYSAQFGQAANVAPATMSYPEQMRNVWETVRPTTQGAQDAAAIAASGIYGAPMDIVGILGGAREVLKGRIPSHEEMSLPGGSQYLEQKAKEKGTLSQEPSLGATATGILGSIFADPMAAAGKFGALAMATMPAKAAGAAEKAAPVVEKALQYSRELTPLGLYSHAADTAAAMPQAMPPQQALNWLKGKTGIRDEELIAAGITTDGKTVTPEFAARGKITGPEFAKMINEGDFPQVTETVLGGDPVGVIVSARSGLGDKVEVGRFNTQEEAYNFASQYNKDKLPGEWAQYYDPIFPEGRQKPYYGLENYPEASTAGGANYREVLLQTPEKPVEYKGFYRATVPNNYWILGNDTLFATESDARKAIGAAKEKLKDPEFAKLFSEEDLRGIARNLDEAYISPEKKMAGVNPNYLQGHYRDFPNVLAHIRMQDFAEPGSNSKILRVEEIQSDWGQKGKDVGWRMTPKELESAEVEQELLARKVEELNKKVTETYERVAPKYQDEPMYKYLEDPEYGPAWREFAKAEDDLINIRNVIKKSQEPEAYPKERYVEDTKDWSSLAVKRILKEAADNPEYGRLQLTAGDVQLNRWSGSDNAEGVAKFYDTTLKSQLEKQVKKLDPDAKVVKRKVEKTAEDDYEIEAAADEVRRLEYEIEDLVERRGYYEDGSDEFLEIEAEIANLENEMQKANDLYESMLKPYTFYEVEITPKMREAIQKGLPRFQRGGKVNPHSQSIVNKALVLSSKLG